MKRNVGRCESWVLDLKESDEKYINKMLYVLDSDLVETVPTTSWVILDKWLNFSEINFSCSKLLFYMCMYTYVYKYYYL